MLGQLGANAQDLAISGDLWALPFVVLAGVDDWIYAAGAGLLGAFLSAAIGQGGPTEVVTISVER
ncbi:MAG: hypothetical protein JKY65_05935 [Planctomycetes bacterium]|nr:hypothetical protein [Planctomycetota bacterium]